MSSSVIRGSCAKRGRKFRPPGTSRVTNEVVEQQHPRPSPFPVSVYQNGFNLVQNREPYAALLTIRPFKKDEKDTVNYLVDCLRFRLYLPSELDEDSHSSTDSPNVNSSDDQNVYRRLLRSSTLASSCSLIAGKRKRPNNTYRLYDRLLQLVDKFDASGVAEVFRLLLERKSAIPLFTPSSKIHYLSLLRHITFPGKSNIRLGEDKTLMRVAVISCRKRNESQTSDLLKSLFHINSILSCDIDQTHFISNEFTAEFGCGCLLKTESSQQAVQDVLVFHVVGDFRPLWPFIMRFSDYLLIEDASKEKDSFQSSFLETDNENLTGQRILTSDLASIANVCLWKPSVHVTLCKTKEAADCGFRHFYIEGQLGQNVVHVFRCSLIVACLDQQSSSNQHKISLHEMPILQDYGFSALPCSSPDEIESSLAEISSSLGESKKKLVALFHKLLLIKDPSKRFLSIRMFEKLLAEKSLRELESQLLNTSHLTENQENNGAIGARVKESVLNIEHLWREMSQLTVSSTRKGRSSEITGTSRLAAQHLLDGFRLELLDGDSNLVHVDWIKEVLHQLSKLIGRRSQERIFVLSVVGVQSSGKSTLLNTMFGVQLPTSVGQCTRGVNMQLLAVEGRPEYDYILLLDTEGTRAPEYYGLPGSEKRDNKMATLSILLSDATIVVIPGENDAAIKEILPVVKMAYQGSKLAESNGGQLSSMMFFVYNRIDTTQKEKLNNIIHTLETSLNEAFDLVQRLKGNPVEKKNSPFRDFKLDASNPSESDVYILGNAKKEFEPPNDVPSAAFGEALAKLREHIHQKVTTYSDGPSWRGRSIGEFSRYVGEVWCCICSADFTLSFTSVMERFNFDKTEFEFKNVEEKLAESYRTNFENLKKEMVDYKGKLMISTGTNSREEDGNLLKSFGAMLRHKIFPVEVVLDEKVKAIVSKKGREKWSIQFQERWRISKLEQSLNWSSMMKTSFTTLFYLEHHVENFKKKMRIEIGAFLKSNISQRISQWNKERKLKKFDSLYCNILTEAVEEFSDLDVDKEIDKVYQESNVIKTRQVEFIDEAIHSVKPTQSPTFLQNKEPTKKFIDCCRFINKVVSHNLTGKLCYDGTIISRAIIDIDSAITSHYITTHSEVQKLHILGRQLLTNSMKTIQQEWEANNSIYVKLQEDSNREALLDYFMISSVGVKKTKLFASVISKLLTRSLATAFGEEMMLKTCKNIRNERWLHDSRFMRKHMDLHLIDLLEKDKISEVLELIYKPQPLYLKVLRLLVSQNVPDIIKESSKFSYHVKRAIQTIQFDAADGVRGIAQRFVCSLQNSFSKSCLKSEHLSKLFLMDVRNEFDECESEDEKLFYDICVDKLTKAVDGYQPPKNSTSYARKISTKVIDYMRMMNDPAALPRCDESCPMCSSFCMEAINHDTRIRPHDAIHQPGGLAGMYNVENMELFSNACNHGFEVDGKFFWNGSNVYRYRDFSKVFIGWKDPRIFEEQPLGEYILATYNDKIAKRYGVKACEEIPLRFYTRNLAGIRAQLEIELGF